MLKLEKIFLYYKTNEYELYEFRMNIEHKHVFDIVIIRQNEVHVLHICNIRH